MVEHTLANKDKVGEGLVLLPGVKDLLEKLQVCCYLSSIGVARVEQLTHAVQPMTGLSQQQRYL